MSSIRSKEILLASVVSGEIGATGNKLNFWGKEASSGNTMWELHDPLNLESALTTIDIEKDLPHSYELTLLFCIAWEFVWGKDPPQLVIDLREDILRKARDGEVLLELEEEWLKLIAVDTDMF